MPVAYDCPYCGEPNEVLVDPTGGEKQEFVEDCAVCCRPVSIAVRCDAGVILSFIVEPES